MTGKFSRKLLCLAVASTCGGTAVAAPAGPVVSVGSATYAPATLTVTSTSVRTQMSWQSFNVAANEVLRFLQPSAQSSVLNHVFDSQSLNILGGLSSNGSVLFMINGIVSGPRINLDLAGAIDSSLRLPRMAFAARSDARVAQPRPLAILADGRIHVIGQDERAVTTAGGDVVLNPGKSIELANAAMPNLRVALTAPHAESINLSRLVGSKGDTGIFAGLFRAPGAARQAAERDDDAVLTASAQERMPTTPDIDRFYRYALLYARLQSEARHDVGGMMKVAAAPASRMILPAARSRLSLLPQDIEIGAPARRLPEAAVALSSLPVAAAPERVATLEPQPIAAAGENEPERNRVTLLALAPVMPAFELVATLELQPIAAAGENEPERNRVTLLALAPVMPAFELVATLEPQPIAAAGENEPERNRVTLLALAPVVPAMELVATLEPQPIAAAGENETERNRVTLLALAPVAEVLATLEPQPIAAAGENETERNRVTLLAFAPVVPAIELVATLEPQPIAAAGENEPERNRVTLLALAPVQPEPSQTAGLESYRERVRKSAPAVIVVAMAQHSATPASREESSVKEVRIERRAPRYFTDYRGALFFM